MILTAVAYQVLTLMNSDAMDWPALIESERT
jgi:hypothetical protein